MSLPLRIGKEAKAELAAAARWYDREKAGLGLDFLRMVDRAIDRIESAPNSGSPVPGVSDPTIRRVLVRRFPYHVVYIELTDRLHVLAIAHQRRRPGYWLNRIPARPQAT